VSSHQSRSILRRKKEDCAGLVQFGHYTFDTPYVSVPIDALRNTAQSYILLGRVGVNRTPPMVCGYSAAHWSRLAMRVGVWSSNRPTLMGLSDLG